MKRQSNNWKIKLALFIWNTAPVVVYIAAASCIEEYAFELAGILGVVDISSTCSFIKIYSYINTYIDTFIYIYIYI